jgi:outer membrane biosynthesis protein TonB
MNIDGGRIESEHQQRLAAIAADLAVTRLQLEQMNEAPPAEPMGRRVLQWMAPVAAIALVAFVGVMVFGGHDAAASPGLRAEAEVIEAKPVEAEPEPIVAPQPVLVAETPEPKPEPVAAPGKPTRPKPPKQPKDPKKPPLTIIDPDGDPLG